MPELLVRKNRWPNPEHAPKFRPALEAYRAACLKLMRQLIHIVAVAIGEKEDFFDRKTTYPVAGIRALYYPPQAATEEEVTGHGPHTDIQGHEPDHLNDRSVLLILSAVMTMVAQSPQNSKALQVLNANGEWISPNLEPETFVVNLGDMMSRLTNDTFLSTVHRVQNNTSICRYSLPFFFGLNGDELTTTLPQFVTPETPLREEYKTGMTGYEHYNRRLQGAHHKHPNAIGKVSPALPRGMTKIDGVLVEGM